MLANQLVTLRFWLGSLVENQRTVRCALDMSGVPGGQHLLSRANDRNGSQDSQVRHRIVRRLTQKEGGKSDDYVTVVDKDVRCAPDCSLARG